MFTVLFPVWGKRYKYTSYQVYIVGNTYKSADRGYNVIHQDSFWGDGAGYSGERNTKKILEPNRVSCFLQWPKRSEEGEKVTKILFLLKIDSRIISMAVRIKFY